MKRLIIMRHAKSDWSDLTASDHERSLNTRGQRSAAAMGAWIRDNTLRPDHVLCSDAARTKETFERLDLGNVPATFTRNLYLAEPEVMRHQLRNLGDGCVMIIAHNPGCAMLAEMLAAKAPNHPDFHRFPTGAAIVLEFETSTWRELPWGSGTCTHFEVPRALMQ